MKKLKLLTVVFMLCLQGMIACRSDDIPPQSSSSNIQDFIHKNGLKRVFIDSLSTDSIVSIKNLNRANSFLLRLKNKAKPFISASDKDDIWQSPKATDEMDIQGIFTFLNTQKATMFFDKKGEIIFLDVDGDRNVSYEYDKTNGYLEITKWGIIATLHASDNQLNSHEFFKIPITRWYAYLHNGWSGVQYLNSPEQANMEGIGKFELIYIPKLKPVTDPIAPIRKIYSD